MFYNNLPLEVIVNIYKYLDVNDIKAAQITCHQWLNASSFLEIQNRIILKLTYADNLIQGLFKNSFRFFPNIYLLKKEDNDKKYDVEHLINFLLIKNISDNVQYLILENIDSSVCNKIKFEMFVKKLQSLPKLKKIKLNQCRFLCDPPNNTEICKQIPYQIIQPSSLRSLTLNSVAFTKKSYEIFTEAGNLKELRIKTNFNVISSTILTQIFKTIPNCLKKLNLEHDALPDFLESQHLLPDLKLEEISFVLHSNNEILKIKCLNFIKMQHLVTSLTLQVQGYTDTLYLDDKEMIEIFKNLPLLENLNIEGNRTLTDKTLIEISKLKHLKRLNINELNDITSDGIISGLVKNKNFNIIELKCEEIGISNEAYKMLTENLPNLEILHCGYDDFPIKYIAKNCKNLINLSIMGYEVEHDEYSCNKPDLISKEHKMDLCLSELKKLKFLKFECVNPDAKMFYKVDMKNLEVLHLNLILYFNYEDRNEQFLTILTNFVQNSPSIKKLLFHASLLPEGYSFDYIHNRALVIILNNLMNLQELDFLIKYGFRNQYIFLIRNREDLSNIVIDCKCKYCVEIKILCGNFVKIK